MKRKKGGKRCRAPGSWQGGRWQRSASDIIDAWQAEASGEVAEALAGLALAVAGEDHATPQQLRQDW